MFSAWSFKNGGPPKTMSLNFEHFENNQKVEEFELIKEDTIFMRD